MTINHGIMPKCSPQLYTVVRPAISNIISIFCVYNSLASYHNENSSVCQVHSELVELSLSLLLRFWVETRLQPSCVVIYCNIGGGFFSFFLLSHLWVWVCVFYSHFQCIFFIRKFYALFFILIGLKVLNDFYTL